MPVSVADRLKAQAIAGAGALLLGSSPQVLERPEYIEIIPTDAQAEQLREMLERWMSREPGVVRVDVMKVLQPIILKKAAPWLLGASALGGVLGRVL